MRQQVTPLATIARMHACPTRAPRNTKYVLLRMKSHDWHCLSLAVLLHGSQTESKLPPFAFQRTVSVAFLSSMKWSWNTASCWVHAQPPTRG
jgi:hypothetical protein